MGEDETERLRARVTELEAELRAARSALAGVRSIVAVHARRHPLPGDELEEPPGGGWRPGGGRPVPPTTPTRDRG